jgi:hypothetical protein
LFLLRALFLGHFFQAPLNRYLRVITLDGIFDGLAQGELELNPHAGGAAQLVPGDDVQRIGRGHGQGAGGAVERDRHDQVVSGKGFRNQPDGFG